VSKQAFRLALVLTAIACSGGLAVSTPARSDTKPSVSRIVLTGAQIGPGYRLIQRPDGHGVAGFVTLDLCGYTFRSEQLRVARLQVNYVRPGSAVKLSNEVVVYRPGGAAEAMREVAAAARTCPKTPVSSTVQGVGPLSYRITRLTDSRLLPGAIALRLRIGGVVRGKRLSETVVSIYQWHGNVFSGVYGYGGTTATREAIATHAAAESAANLKRN